MKMYMIHGTAILYVESETGEDALRQAESVNAGDWDIIEMFVGEPEYDDYED